MEPTHATIALSRKLPTAISLTFSSDEVPGISRRKSGRGWSYRDTADRVIRDRETIKRINALGIPPAYTSVWICPSPVGHIQATGRDAKGRKQYRYHSQYRDLRDGTKYEHMMVFAQQLPAIRAAIDQHMALPGLPREKLLATIVHLLEATMIRVGNADYAKQNKSYGLTTLNDRHVQIDGSELRFRFKGKSGKQWNLKLRDRRVARIVKASQDMPGQHLFQYVDENGEAREVTSGDVNDYLREISEAEITAKDFRTWTGTVLAALAVSEFEHFDSDAAAKRNVRAAIENVSARLGNTPSVCRKCYVHPEIIDSYMSKSLVLEVKDEVDRELRDELSDLRPEEVLVLAFLRRRLEQRANA